MSQWNIEELVTEDDVPFEESLSKHPRDEATWLEYIEKKTAGSDEIGFQSRIFVLDRAVAQVPRSFEVWMKYFDVILSIRSISPSKVVGLFQKCLCFIQDSETLWIKYLEYITENYAHDITLIRRSFNDALFHLSLKDQKHVWRLYLRFADTVGGISGAGIYMKYYQYSTRDELNGSDPEESNTTIDVIISKLFEFGDSLNGVKLIHALISHIDDYLTLPRSPAELWLEFVDLLTSSHASKPSNSSLSQYELDDLIQSLVLQGISKFPDQVGKLYTKLILHYVDRKLFDKVRFYCHKSLKECKTLKDFTLLFDIYTEFEQSVIVNLETRIEADPENQMLIKEADFRIAVLEKFIDDRELLINDMKLRQDSNNLDEWLKRVEIFENRNTQQLLEVYVKALTTINPLQIVSITENNTFADLWIKYATVYSNSDDIRTTELIYSKAIKSQFKHPDDLSKLYMAWSETLLGHGDEEKSIKLIRDVLFDAPPPAENKTIDYEDSALPVQTRVHKSTKLWSFYLDLLESMLDEIDEDDTDSTMRHNKEIIKKIVEAYEFIISLKIATPKILLNYASFLQQRNYWEKSFTIYELSLRLFKNHKIKFEIWNEYLTKIIQFNNNSHSISIERLRDLFDQCLQTDNKASDHETIPPSLTKSIYILYSQFEEDSGSLIKSLKVLEAGTQAITKWLNNTSTNHTKAETSAAVATKLELYRLLIHKVTTTMKDDERLRQIYQTILNDAQLRLPHLVEVTVEFIDFEMKHSQLTRVRSLFQFITRLSHPESSQMIPVWDKWEKFELENGNEATFKDMLRFKRAVQEDFKNDVVVKDTIQSLSFVKGSTSQANKNSPTPEANPDAIDLDMDMS